LFTTQLIGEGESNIEKKEEKDKKKIEKRKAACRLGWRKQKVN
jgi:hypothetical protein